MKNNLTFYKISSAYRVVNFLVDTLEKHLNNGKRVLWLVPGGSSITIAVAVSKALRAPLDALTISLTDERWGPVGHSDSNWQRLKDAGFESRGARLVPVLNGQDMDRTTREFDHRLAVELKAAEFSLGLFGLGDDGHTAGILPGSPAVNAKTLTAGYDAGQYKRITTTPKAISLLDEAVVYAVGEEKHEAIDNLDQDLTIAEQPAQALKRVSKVSIFNDYKGEKL